MDSASEFLFGNNVGSLSAGIPYPPSAGKRTQDGYYVHPSTIFTDAFSAGQVKSAERFGLGTDWPLAELWKDRVKPFRKVVDDFTESLMTEALKKRERDVLQKEKSTGAEDAEDVTLLTHLVRHTQGVCIECYLLNARLNQISYKIKKLSKMKYDISLSHPPCTQVLIGSH